MIYVINYNKSKRKQLYLKLEALNVDFEIGTNEVSALKAEKIILPDAENPLFALRKLHLLNLHSVLRMYPRPVLGIGAGFLLMLNKCEEKSCFAFFPYSAKFSEEKEKWEIFDETGNLLNKTFFKSDKYFGIIDFDHLQLNRVLIDFINTPS